jgi:hypothetical protein
MVPSSYPLSWPPAWKRTPVAQLAHVHGLEPRHD